MVWHSKNELNKLNIQITREKMIFILRVTNSMREVQCSIFNIRGYFFTFFHHTIGHIDTSTTHMYIYTVYIYIYIYIYIYTATV